MECNCKFSTYNPIISFIFYIGAIVLGMFLKHPYFLLCSMLFSFSLFITIKGKKVFRLLAYMIPVFILVSLINPLFNTLGENVIFSYFGRPYTLEALLYGMAQGAMFVSIILWFASYNEIMTSDKFLYIFGRSMPSISMIITMVLRFVPNYMRQAVKISNARKCVGMGEKGDSRSDKIKSGATVLSVLTSWALEGGIVTADSMRSRGFGVGKRTSFSIYRFDSRDLFLSIILTVFLILSIFCGINGGAKVNYTPNLEISGFDNIYTIIGVISYSLFLVLPTALNIEEKIIWRILRSKI